MQRYRPHRTRVAYPRAPQQHPGSCRTACRRSGRGAPQTATRRRPPMRWGDARARQSWDTAQAGSASPCSCPVATPRSGGTRPTCGGRCRTCAHTPRRCTPTASTHCVAHSRTMPNTPTDPRQNPTRCHRAATHPCEVEGRVWRPPALRRRNRLHAFAPEKLLRVREINEANGEHIGNDPDMVVWNALSRPDSTRSCTARISTHVRNAQPIRHRNNQARCGCL